MVIGVYERVYWYEVRWQCQTCGRFIAESSVKSVDYPSPDRFFGVDCRVWGSCSKCGRVEEPRRIPTVERSCLELR